VGNSGKQVENFSASEKTVESRKVVVDACPRCGVENAGLEACPRCGLKREFRAKFAEGAALPEGLVAAWETVVSRWDDAAAHAVFLETCAQAEALDLAAGRYRAWLEDPARAERCRAALDRIVALAEERLRRTAASRDTPARNKKLVAVLAFLIMAGFLALIGYELLMR
jgi:hypothetical protein